MYGQFISRLNESGNIYEYVTSPFTNIMGSYFYLFMAFMAEAMIFLKSQDVTLHTVIGLLFSGAFAMYLPHEAGVAILVLLSSRVKGVRATIRSMARTGADTGGTFTDLVRIAADGI